MKNLYLLLSTLAFLILTSTSVAHAAPKTPIAPNPNAPTPEVSIYTIADPLVRVVNLITIAAGLVFVMMLFYSAYKYSLAQGDPKALAGAKETLTHAIMGFIVTVGTFAIINIVSGFFGVDQSILDSPGKASESAIQKLMICIQQGVC